MKRFLLRCATTPTVLTSRSFRCSTCLAPGIRPVLRLKALSVPDELSSSGLTMCRVEMIDRPRWTGFLHQPYYPLVKRMKGFSTWGSPSPSGGRRASSGGALLPMEEPFIGRSPSSYGEGLAFYQSDFATSQFLLNIATFVVDCRHLLLPLCKISTFVVDFWSI